MEMIGILTRYDAMRCQLQSMSGTLLGRYIYLVFPCKGRLVCPQRGLSSIYTTAKTVDGSPQLRDVGPYHLPLLISVGLRNR